MSDNQTVDPKSVPYLLDIIFESYSDKCGYKSSICDIDGDLSILAPPKYTCLNRTGPRTCNVEDCPFTRLK